MFGEYVTALGGTARNIWGDELLPLFHSLAGNPWTWGGVAAFLIGAYLLLKK